MTNPDPVAPVQSIRELRKAYTRDRLVEAAKGLFKVQGFEATSVDEIVSEAGTSRATFYLHFNQKSDIAVAIGDEMWVEAERFFRDLPHLPDWSSASLRQWIEGDVQQWRDKHEVTHALTPSAVADHDPATVPRRVADIADATVAEGGLWSTWPAPQARLRALLVINLLVSYFQQWDEAGFVIGEQDDLTVVTRAIRFMLTEASN